MCHRRLDGSESGDPPERRDQGRRAIIRLRQLSFGSQVKLLLALVPFTALVVFEAMLALQLAGSSVGDEEGIAMLIAVALIFAVMIAALQVAALAILRLLPWQGPSLRVEADDHLRRIFE
ncbi:MAG TPA: hypothetical protein VE891_01055 [Allosphingosinicella sp.]|nr:hypothetical protein [Allosphingosinicella sp.]